MGSNHLPYVVGLAGGSASGKTSILNDLVAEFGRNEVSMISQDNYYFERHLQVKDENGEINFDLPTAIDSEAFHNDVSKLLLGERVITKEYTYNNPGADTTMLAIEPASILIIEGLFVFHFSEIADKMDLKVYVDAKEEIKLKRRILRDAMERGYPESDVRYRWSNHVMPSYHRYLRPHRDTCDLIITNNHSYEKGLQVLIHHLKAILG